MDDEEGVAVLERSGKRSRRNDGAVDADLLLPPKWIATVLSGQGSPASNKNSLVSGTTDVSTLSTKKWAGMRLVDIVMLDGAGDVESWVFTAKTGHVTSKKRAQDRTKIAERFERFALANPRNKERFVALLQRASTPGQNHADERIILDDTTLREALHVGSSQQVRPELRGACLQCYLRPQNGSNSFLRGYYRHQSGRLPCYSLSRVSPLYRSPNSELGFPGGGDATPGGDVPIEGDDPESVRLRTETERTLTSLVAFLQPQLDSGATIEAGDRAIAECQADFVIDDNGELWLISLPSVAVVPTVERKGSTTTLPISTTEHSISAVSGATKLSRDEEGGDESSNNGEKTASSVHMPPLLGGTTIPPQAAAPLDGSDSTPLGSARLQISARSDGLTRITSPSTAGDSARQQLERPFEGELPAIPSTMLGARSSPGDHNSSSAGEKHGQHGSPLIIEKKAGVYVASMHASALRGLCCWREGRKRSSLRGRDSPRWQLVEGRYKGNLASEEPRIGMGGDGADTVLDSRSSPSSFEELSTARYKMTARSVLLAMAEASFLRGDEPLYPDKGGMGGSLAQRWRECDRRAQLSLASANPQAYYDEVTVCGNCMEICGKLDSIRTAGFPDTGSCGGEAAAGTAASGDEASNPSGPVSSRPRSEPLPESIPAAGGLSGTQRRPGSADSGTSAALTSSAAGPVRREEPRGGLGDGGATSDEPEGGKGGDSPSSRSDGTHSPTGGGCGGEGPAREPGGADVPREGQAVGGEITTNGVDRTPEEEHGVATEAAAKPARVDSMKGPTTRRDKGGNSKSAIDRIASVYRDGARTGGGKKLAKPASKTKKAGGHSSSSDLPNVATVARFAIERERLAREMGLDELGGPATLGVVNVGAAVTHGQQQHGYRNAIVKGGGRGNKRARSHQRSGGKHAAADGGSSGGGGDGGGVGGGDNPTGENNAPATERRSAAEVLLEKLESVAEARSIESAGGPEGRGNRREQDAHWRTQDEEGELSTFGYSAGERGAGAGGGPGAAWGDAAPVAGELSTTESAFLERSRRANDLDGGGRGGGDSMFGHHFEAGFREEHSGGGADIGGGGVGGGSGGGHVATIGVLRDRLATVEGENAALRSRARKAEEERAAEAARGDRACKKLAQARTEFSRAMLEKDEDYRRRELALQERHSRELAKKSQASAEEMMMSLIARLDQALKDMAEQQRRFAQTKRTLLAEKTMEVASAEAKGRRELQETRSLVAAMEDKAASLQEQVSEAAKQISTLKAREDEQRKRRQTAEEEADKIRKEISILRQTVQASQSMDVKDESGGRRDAQSTLAAVTATSEARIRTLNNKVDFLKAQLASEQTLKAEVEAALASSRRSVFEAKDESRKQAAASDKAREAAVEEAVARVNRQVEESMTENYRIQSKVQTLQDQLNDALGDLSLARRREEALKAEVAVSAAKLEDRGAELAKAQARADDLAEARAADTESSADRAGREAVVRRLDNERQYLKSQLQSEITCKDELREALNTATRQLGDIKADWADEQASRTEEFQRELQAKTEAMSDLTAEKVAMEAELVAVSRQLSLLKDGYSKARDNLRAEQLALETARTANRRLREEVTASTEELAAIKTQQGEDARRHSQSLVAAKTALDEADESKRRQGVEQQMQLREQLLKTGEVQRQLMRLQNDLAGRELAAERRLAAERLGQGLARWCANRKASAFYRILSAVVLVAAESDVRERTRRALREAGEGARRAQNAAVEEARAAAASKAEEEMAEADRCFSEERDRLLEEAEAAAAVAATQVQTIEELRAQEAGTRREFEKARAEVKENSRRYRESSERAAQEAKTRSKERVEAAISSTKEACEEANAREKENSDEKWRGVLREHLRKAGEEAAAVAAAVGKEHDAILEETQQAFRVERERLREETERLVSAAAEAERQRGLELLAVSQEALDESKESLRALQEEMSALTQAKEALESKVADLREELNQAALARSADREERRRADVEAAEERAKLEKDLARARERAVELEGGKWRRASEEAEARAATEQAAAYERGTADRGKQAEAEALQLHDAAEKALEEVKQGARATIEEMAVRHSEDLEAERKRVSEEEAVAREAALEAAREEFAQQQAKAVANARAAATAEARARAERDRAAAVEAAKERERLATEKVQDELRSARTEWAAERRRLKEQTAQLEEAEQKAKEGLLRAMANSSQATQRARARWEEAQKSAMEKNAAEAVEEREKALEDARRAFNREKKRALMENQDAFTAQAEAMAVRMRKQAAASLQKVENSLGEMRQEKDRLAAELETTRKALKECESSLVHSEADLKEQLVSHSVDTWRMVVAAVTLRLKNDKAAERLRQEAAAREKEAESTFEAQKEALSANVEELLELAFDSRKRFASMQETLVNHKREVLIDHKVQSSSLHKELDSLARDREKLEEQRLLLQREFRELEGQAKDAEKEAHAHSRQSAIGPDGMVIPARARKKRRLDEELEGLLEAMESKRKALVAVDGKLADLAESRAVKDEEMKGLERTLVQVLVEQQKKLLSLLSEAGEQAAQLQEIDERTRFARDEAKRLKAQAKRQQQERAGGVGG